jgi:hypothetical protein
MSTVPIPSASLFLGIIPALILLYIGLKGYEGYYKDKNIFLTFIVGIFIGFIAALVQSLTYAGIIIYTILLAFFDQLFKTIILNIGRLQRKKETTIYGLSLGLGFGSSFTPFLLIGVSSIITSDLQVLSTVTAGSIGIILFHGATGAYIGYGVYTGKLMKYALTAIVIQMPFNFIVGMLIIYSRPEHLYILIGFATILILYGVIVFWYITKKIMPQIIDSKQRRKRRKKSVNK